MINQVTEYSLPSPVEGLQFTVTVNQGVSTPVFRVQGGNTFMSILSQGPPQSIVLTLQWTAAGKIWESDQPTKYVNLYGILSLPNATWVLLEVTAK